MNKENNHGFTLTELMIVMAVVVMLAAIGLPTYHDLILKSRRTHAIAGLEDLALREEKWRANNPTYTSIISNLGYPASGKIAKGHYVAIISKTGTTGIGYQITADSQAKDGQNKDICGDFVLTKTAGDQIRTVTGTESVDRCWKN